MLHTSSTSVFPLRHTLYLPYVTYWQCASIYYMLNTVFINTLLTYWQCASTYYMLNTVFIYTLVTYWQCAHIYYLIHTFNIRHTAMEQLQQHVQLCASTVQGAEKVL